MKCIEREKNEFKVIFIELLNQGYISDENERNKKQVLVFLSVNFGLTFLLGLGRYIFYKVYKAQLACQSTWVMFI